MQNSPINIKDMSICVTTSMRSLFKIWKDIQTDNCWSVFVVKKKNQRIFILIIIRQKRNHS